jgi:hypothetical protein
MAHDSTEDAGWHPLRSSTEAEHTFSSKAEDLLSCLTEAQCQRRAAAALASQLTEIGYEQPSNAWGVQQDAALLGEHHPRERRSRFMQEVTLLLSVLHCKHVHSAMPPRSLESVAVILTMHCNMVLA